MPSATPSVLDQAWLAGRECSDKAVKHDYDVLEESRLLIGSIYEVSGLKPTSDNGTSECGAHLL
jgi:hypothetical protein